jgi:hypothetical protein
MDVFELPEATGKTVKKVMFGLDNALDPYLVITFTDDSKLTVEAANQQTSFFVVACGNTYTPDSGN